ncbi:MAG: NTP transferase domain-containing protein [Methylotenera sp.]|nr:NTP transferase domain-containing protein [Methylotenera sp.]MDP2281386.1 NTP transferase domain-containing protein [Methylotenera sp.]MDP3061112.1 NTP transferase domain-containing protein [Methylotenera sp.]
MSHVKHAVIAAAGLGSRLGMGKPKCLIEIGGMTILEHQLKLLDHIEDLRVVVGFEEDLVIDLIRQLRPETIIVRNPGYRATTTLHSYAMGASYLNDDCLFLDGDILFQQSSLDSFIQACRPDITLVGITPAKTKDAVFVHLNQSKQITSFSRSDKSNYEWANIVWIKPKLFHRASTAVYERLAEYLPLDTKEVNSNEIDTKEDMDNAIKNLAQFSLR